MSRWQRLSILAALVLSGCGIFPDWPSMPSKGTCRTFALTSWGGGAPWSELSWDTAAPDIVHIDEPMLPMWGWKGDLGSQEDVCGPIGIGMVREKIAALRVKHPTAKVWLNWSTDEWIALTSLCPDPPGLGADIVSMASYGGLWDWETHLRHRLNQMARLLEPGQMMGLVPEAFACYACGIDYPESDLVQLAHIYMDYAFQHQDVVYGIAPFMYQNYEGMIGFKSMPKVAAVWAAFQSEYPRCG